MSGKIPLSTSDTEFAIPLLQITRDEYISLVTTAQHFDTLCRNLINGGVQRETIELLSTQAPNTSDARNTDSVSYSPTESLGRSNSVQQPSHNIASARPRESSHARSYSFVPYSNSNSNQSTVDGTGIHDSESDNDSSENSLNHSPSIEGDASASFLSDTPTAWFEREATRTVQLLNLAEGTTLADITSVVSGGLLVDIFFRARDNTVALSFLNSSDAHAFYHHVQTNGLHIKCAKIDISWSDRQFFLTKHIAHQIGSGACRNLVIRYCNPNHTEQEIRNDLEHIHNLVVIQVQFVGGNCYISTNSVARAMFARTCMMSRQKYKGSRIEWGVDECAKPLPKMPTRKMPMARQDRRIPAPTKGSSSSATNRFEVLRCDE